MKLACTNHKRQIKHWEELLPEALYAIRTLLCTSTNAVPHENFKKFSRGKFCRDLSSVVSLTVRNCFVKAACLSEQIRLIGEQGGIAGSKPTLH